MSSAKFKNFKSDKRISGGKKGTCKLCQKEKSLRLSHIAPKWCYQWMKKEKNGKIIGFYPSLDKVLWQQDGSKHYLLCDECEQFLSESENYIRILMHGSKKQKQKLGIHKKGKTYSNLNFQLIQRFIFGLIIKSHYATSAPFHNILISDKHLTEIRKRTLNDNNNDFTYPIAALGFYSKKIRSAKPESIMIPCMQLINEDEEYLISFLIAGWEWILFFYNLNDENHDRWIISFLKKNRLKKEGSLKVNWRDITDQRFIEEWITNNND